MIDSLGDRIKNCYENIYRYTLPRRQPAILRLDGKAFHSLTRKCEKPFDSKLSSAIDKATQIVLKHVQNARMAYAQSDEVSMLLIDYNKFVSTQWFDGNIQKIVSVAASIMGVEFSKEFGVSGYFDARVFAIPERDLVNYFVWRQADAVRNSIQSAARANFTHKECENKNCNQLQQMLLDRNIDWNNYPTPFRHGRIITKDGSVDENVPIFSEDRQYIEKFLKIEEE